MQPARSSSKTIGGSVCRISTCRSAAGRSRTAARARGSRRPCQPSPRRRRSGFHAGGVGVLRLRCSRRRLRMHCVFEGIGGRGRVAGLVAVACVRAWVRERAPNTFGVRRWSALVHAWGVGAPSGLRGAICSALVHSARMEVRHLGSSKWSRGRCSMRCVMYRHPAPLAGRGVSILHVRPAVLNDGARRSLFGCGSRALRRPPLPRQTSTTRAARSRRPRRRRSRRRAAPPPTAAARRRPRAPRRSGT